MWLQYVVHDRDRKKVQDELTNLIKSKRQIVDDEQYEIQRGLISKSEDEMTSANCRLKRSDKQENEIRWPQTYFFYLLL